MALNLNPFLNSKLTTTPYQNHLLLTTPSLALLNTGLLERTHYSSSGHSGHSGGGYQHHYPQKKKKRSIALTALTLLSFLFFLNILQNCIQEHIHQMSPTMMVMQMQTTGGGAAAAIIRKADRKGDNDGVFYNDTLTLKDSKIEIKSTTAKPKMESHMVKEKPKAIKPTKASLYVPYDEYQYAQVPIKIKTVEKYSYKRRGTVQENKDDSIRLDN